MMDLYIAGKMADYTRNEIARARGNRKWKPSFSR